MVEAGRSTSAPSPSSGNGRSVRPESCASRRRAAPVRAAHQVAERFGSLPVPSLQCPFEPAHERLPAVENDHQRRPVGMDMSEEPSRYPMPLPLLDCWAAFAVGAAFVVAVVGPVTRQGGRRGHYRCLALVFVGHASDRSNSSQTSCTNARVTGFWFSAKAPTRAFSQMTLIDRGMPRDRSWMSWIASRVNISTASPPAIRRGS